MTNYWLSAYCFANYSMSHWITSMSRWVNAFHLLYVWPCVIHNSSSIVCCVYFCHEENATFESGSLLPEMLRVSAWCIYRISQMKKIFMLKYWYHVNLMDKVGANETNHKMTSMIRSSSVTLITCPGTIKLDCYGGTSLASIIGFWGAGGTVTTKAVATSWTPTHW
jgi:hypothetical protein